MMTQKVGPGFGIKSFRIHTLGLTSVADPGSSGFLTPGPGMGKKSGSGMNSLDHISESLENNFLGSNTVLKFFDANPGSGME
jgi:hypothetical protein